MKVILSVFIVVGFLFSCVEAIELDDLSYEQAAIVDGFITNELEKQTIRVQYTAPVTRQVFDPVSDLRVLVRSDQGDEFELTEENPGEYSFIGRAEEGKSYFIEVFQDNVLIAKSGQESLPNSLPMDSLSWTESLKSYTDDDGRVRNLWSVETFGYAHLDDVTEPHYLRFGEVETVFFFPEITNKGFPPPKDCYIYNYDLAPKLELIELVPGTQNVEIVSTIFQKPITYEFAYVLSLKADLISMNLPTFQYWKQLETLFNQTGNITDKIPAQFIGNVSQLGDVPILGQFSVVSKTSKVIFIRRSDLMNKPVKLCGEVGGPYPQRPDGACLECLSHEGASTTIPEYW